jgi:phenylacetate-CoA ligase
VSAATRARRSTRARLWAHLVYRPSLRRVTRHPVLRELAALEAEQWGSPSEVEAAREARLRELLRFAAARVPYYRRIIQRERIDIEAGPAALALARLPTLTREMLSAARGDLIAEGEARPGAAWNQTGGSTGEPVSFLQDDAYRAANLAAAARHDRWAGWDFGVPTAVIWGADRDLARRLPARQRLETALLRRQIELDAFDLDARRLEDFSRRLAVFRPRVVRGYAAALDLCAAYLAAEGRPFAPPVGIISCAETLTSEMRARLESAFSAPVFDRYGSREFGLIASQCEAGAYHLNSRGVHAEVLDGAHPAPPGGRGRVVITGLACRAMPLIRYETGDVAEVPAPGACRCGRGLPLFGRVEGRISDFLRTPDGRLVHGEFFTHLFYGREGVRGFSVVQDASGRVIVSAAGEAGALAQHLPRVADAVRERLGAGAEVEALAVDRIVPPASGKRSFVRSEAGAHAWLRPSGS